MSQPTLPTIAVVIPNHNDADYLGVCIDSVLGLSGRPEQIIFVDDCSSDASPAIAGARLKDVPGATVCANRQRLGTMGALNVGLAHATTDYVLFLASNDYLDGEMLTRARRSIAEKGETGVWSAMMRTVDVDGGNEQVFPSAVVAVHEQAFAPDACVHLANCVGNWFTGTTLLFHRASLQQIGGFEPQYGGLADLFAALTLSSLKGAIFCPVPYGVMRRHAGGYLWRTLTNHEQLEDLLRRLAEQGPNLSSALFTKSFLARTQRRIRHSAIRALPQGIWPTQKGVWQQGTYGLLARIRPIALRNLMAFVLLRPFDVLPFFWFRVVRYRWIMLRDRIKWLNAPCTHLRGKTAGNYKFNTASRRWPSASTSDIAGFIASARSSKTSKGRNACP